MIAKNQRDLETKFLRLLDALIQGHWELARYYWGRNLGKSIRVAQLNLARSETTYWNDILRLLGFGVDEALLLGAQSSTILVDYLITNTNGLDADFWWRSIMAQARVGRDSLASKRLNDIRLSELVYNNRQKGIRKVQAIIRQGLRDGLNQKEIGKLVLKWINPNTPGGSKYAARRLARTEIGNAFHRSSIEQYKVQPWVNGVKWNLSGTHKDKKSDACDDYANSVHYRKGEPGVFKPDQVPGKPHPQCMCYLTPVVMDKAEFQRKMGTIKQFTRLWLRQLDTENLPHV